MSRVPKTNAYLYNSPPLKWYYVLWTIIKFYNPFLLGIYMKIRFLGLLTFRLLLFTFWHKGQINKITQLHKKIFFKIKISNLYVTVSSDVSFVKWIRYALSLDSPICVQNTYLKNTLLRPLYFCSSGFTSCLLIITWNNLWSIIRRKLNADHTSPMSKEFRNCVFERIVIQSINLGVVFF